VQQLEQSATAERLFIAVALPDEVRHAIAARLLPIPGRLVQQANWHFTLRFLGATSANVRDKLIRELSSISLGSDFRIQFNGIGAFPRAKRARIVWLGVSEGADSLIGLAAKAESAARSAGFAAEGRAFTPHLTLSRIEPPQSMVNVIAAQPSIDIPMDVSEVVLMRSTLGKGPARYDVVERFSLR
jgi:2'-5' RNA ligase